MLFAQCPDDLQVPWCRLGGFVALFAPWPRRVPTGRWSRGSSNATPHRSLPLLASERQACAIVDPSSVSGEHPVAFLKFSEAAQHYPPGATVIDISWCSVSCLVIQDIITRVRLAPVQIII